MAYSEMCGYLYVLRNIPRLSDTIYIIAKVTVNYCEDTSYTAECQTLK